MYSNRAKKHHVAVTQLTMKGMKKALSKKFREFKISNGRVYSADGLELDSDKSLSDFWTATGAFHSLPVLVLSGQNGWKLPPVSVPTTAPALSTTNVDAPCRPADWTVSLKAAAPPSDLLDAARSPRVDGVVLFWNATDENGYLSNWKRALMLVDGECYTSVEQWIMAEKTRCCKQKGGVDKLALRKVMRSRSPRDMKKIGRQVNLDKKEWSRKRSQALLRGIDAKFRHNLPLTINLLRTGSKALAEASPSDTTFGIGLAPSDPKAAIKESWKGQNLLGKALEMVRGELRTEIFAAASRFAYLTNDSHAGLPFCSSSEASSPVGRLVADELQH